MSSATPNPVVPTMELARREVRALLSLGLPIVATQLLESGLLFVDGVMAGNAGPDELAGVSLGSAIWMPIFLTITGVLVVLSALVAHAIGEQAPHKAVDQTHQGLWLGVTLGVIGWWICQHGAWFTHFLQVTPDVRTRAEDYLAAVGWSAPAIGLYQPLRSFCEGQARTRQVMMFMALGFLVNIPADYILVFGLGPIQPMGGVGCGWATSLVIWLMVLAAWGYTRVAARKQRLPSLYTERHPPRKDEILRLARLGVPVAMGIFFEASLFSIISLLVSAYGAVVLSGHQIAYILSATTYMVPLSMGMAISVRAGYFLGRKDRAGARLAALSGIAVSVCFAVVAALLILVFRQDIAALYSPDPAVVAVASHLLVMAAIFQLSDAIQASTSGALRGYRDTRAIMLATLLAYWGFGLPLGYMLAKGIWIFPQLGVQGYWSGLIIGLTAAAIFLFTRLWRMSRQPLTDVTATEEPT
ncbi:MATE family efflux transporter [Mangrovitalea sediminis]|uniref:MATE family efflux transporter n=1 Tax=Mangrovitalea sediminis TaxID=1982043 RepID=UPI0011773B57|nr:MATE family efflux transporter [Mangrovitalea sediminis]